MGECCKQNSEIKTISSLKDSFLTPRERVRIALSHHEPDRIPLDFGSTAANMTNPIYFSFLKHYGLRQSVDPFTIHHSANFYDERIISHLGTDFRHVYLLPPFKYRFPQGLPNKFINEWGVLCRRVGAYLERVNAPLSHASLDDLEKYSWPNPNLPGRLEGLKERIEYLFFKTDYALMATIVDNGPLEIAIQLRGYEQFMIDMIDNPIFAKRLLFKITQIEKALLQKLLEITGEYLDVVQVGDDLGSQTGPLISPYLYRTLIKPFHQELFSLIKSLSPAKISFHSDGNIFPFIPDFIDAGVDILNPIQLVGNGMEPKYLKNIYGKKISFHGGIDIQNTLPFCSYIELEKELKKIISIFAPGGGYILAPTHNIQPDTPIEKVELMYSLAQKLGSYPIRI